MAARGVAGLKYMYARNQVDSKRSFSRALEECWEEETSDSTSNIVTAEISGSEGEVFSLPLFDGGSTDCPGSAYPDGGERDKR